MAYITAHLEPITYFHTHLKHELRLRLSETRPEFHRLHKLDKIAGLRPDFSPPQQSFLVMASSAAATAVRRAVAKIAPPASSGVRQFHATGAKRYSDDYIHADHMYNITAMKNRKLKMGVGVFGSLAIGIMVPIWAVQFQMKKAGGGV
ncbi:hypothetical protein KC19_11G076900 [Ceratodon purpureus]|uniref:Uncharacterized protein n=1 Tax=Ceratodon purpureus TaxID=3225 RepID=A0A8T0GHX5_CERPU|nr:hypothetical protein KC19_11G076900 [Ceratodon purpureus]